MIHPVGLAMGVVLSVAVGLWFANLGRERLEASADEALGDQHARIAEGTAAYVRANYQSLLTAAAGGPVAIPYSTLTAAGAANPLYASENKLGQTYLGCAWRDATAPNLLNWLLAAQGGDAQQDPRVARVAWSIQKSKKASGAFVHSTIDPSHMNCVSGACLPINLNVCASAGVTLAPGRAVALGWYNSNTLLTNFLYRYPGTPDGNVMHQDIAMNQNSVTGATDVVLDSTSSTGTTLANRPLATQLRSGDILAKPNCPAGTTPRVTAAVNSIAEPTATAFSGFGAETLDNGPSWTVRGYVDTEDGKRYLTPADGYFIVTAACI